MVKRHGIRFGVTSYSHPSFPYAATQLYALTLCLKKKIIMYVAFQIQTGLMNVIEIEVYQF